MGFLAATWGVFGFLALLCFAIYRLSGVAHDAIAGGLAWHHWSVLLVFVVFMAYYEGLKGFQRAYSPRFVARAGYLSRHPTPLRATLAPLFCMGFFDAPRRRIITAVLLTAAIILLITTFRQLPQPWRGVLDAGVVVGLTWGTIATVAIGIRALIVRGDGVDPEVP